MTAPTRRPPVVRAGPRLAARAKAERRERRFRVLRRTGFGALAMLPVVGLLWLILVSPVLGVGRVSVHGTERLVPAQIAQVARVQAGTPLARVDTAGITARVAAVDGVASVRVHRGWPSTLEITVAERQPVAAIRRAGRWAFIDGGGNAFAALATQPAGLAVLDLPQPGPGDDATRSALQVLGSLPPTLRAQVASVRAPTPSGVVLVLGGGQLITWGPPGDTVNKAAAVQALLRRGARAIDVSSPGVATTDQG